MRISLRVKLTLVSLLLLFIPLTGFRFSELIKQDLVASREETMLFSARAVASALSGRTGLFANEIFHSLNPSKDLYLYQLSNPMRINGKVDDWQPHLKEAQEFGRDQLLRESRPYYYESLHYKHLTGVRGKYLHAIFLVTDDHIVYRSPNSLRLDQSDHLQIGIEDREGTLHQYLVTAFEPGWVNGFLMSDDVTQTIPMAPEPRIQGMWSVKADGYILEIRLPMAMVGQKLGFAIADVDDEKQRTVDAVIGTATIEDGKQLGWLISPSDAIANILKSLDKPHSRVLIVDSNRRVRASFGELAEKDEPHSNTSLIGTISTLIYRLLSPLYTFFTQPFTTDFKDTPPQPTTLDIKGIEEALYGTSTVTSYSIQEGMVEVMAAITPLREGEAIIGAVVVEQTTNSILALQNRVIEESLTLTILVFIFGGAGIIFFASRLSWRIRRLGNQAASAISESGQIQSTIEATAAKDEIGDLSRTLTSMLIQLKIQTEYREKMADNLEHEMRTPLAGISASLKNMMQEMEDLPESIKAYLGWALEDVTRLESLLTAVRDATNLQQALSKDFMEDFELDTAMEMWLNHSWKQAFPETNFIYHKPPYRVILHGDPARIRQMLDKLVENAVSFHTPGSAIELSLKKAHNNIEIQVSNIGAAIPEELKNQIFNSMVSYRRQKEQQPHLGLGLYIVRTIVEHHQGTVSVHCSEEDRRTTFTLTL